MHPLRTIVQIGGRPPIRSCEERRYLLRLWTRSFLLEQNCRLSLAERRRERQIFYASDRWRKLRYKALLTHGKRCACCGSGQEPFHVDHIKPRSKYPDLQYELTNLQVLCADCNLGKGAWDQTDWRSSNR